MFGDEFLAASISLLSLSSFDAVDSFSTKEHSRLRLLDYVESHPLRDRFRKKDAATIHSSCLARRCYHPELIITSNARNSSTSNVQLNHRQHRGAESL